MLSFDAELRHVLASNDLSIIAALLWKGLLQNWGILKMINKYGTLIQFGGYDERVVRDTLKSTIKV